MDAGGTLLQLREPVGETYARLGRPFGVARSPAEIRAAFSAAFAAPWPGLRYQGDGRPFWRGVVSAATGCDDPTYFELLYAHYALPDAWQLPEGALPTIAALRGRGVKVAVVSNWDARLRGLLEGMGLLAVLDAALISAEVGVEKPDPALFLAACDALGVRPADALHIGDDPHLDRDAALSAGCQARLWGEEIAAFPQLLFL